LNQVGNVSLATGRLCVSQFPFAYNKERLTIDNAAVGGIVGISPARSSHNFIWRLFDSGFIKRALVGINYEKWGDYHQRSRINMGYIDFDEIVDGEDGANYYSNLGGDYWGLMMDDFAYGDVDMTENQQQKIAFIDSANTTIQLPEFVFNNTLKKMQEAEKDGVVFQRDRHSDGSILI